MKCVIAGGTGVVGNGLADLFLNHGYDVTILTRRFNRTDGKRKYVKWLGEGDHPENELEGVDYVINLAGTSLNEGRWSQKRKAQIMNSRLRTVEELIRIINKLEHKPKVLINASAIGIYPPSDEAVYTERAELKADDFLGTVVQRWEEKAQQFEKMQIRTVFARFGLILANEGGALPLLQLPYRMFFGGKIGSGNQWVSWIHIVDAARALFFIAENEQISGPVNVTAPQPVRMHAFGKTVAKSLHRPDWFVVPSKVLQLLLGEKSMLVLKGQHVYPEKLMDSGFSFSYPNLNSALLQLEKEKKER
ncbi:TIGR01777 family oxidoreductase [Fervidibacillus albus]|uniref:TIGR01777 family oxidoreductase n=1 Tax=Fervidibacillus albus TaxID=2980026 RepID=A0A9E8LWD9_9BACI|nr:TIGR01777 family oxidoreductase [Fervidibacillus albus]WAA10917.1 TIGR01777 family oxidoreductase [Fervidibacillus albus]